MRFPGRHTAACVLTTLLVTVGASAEALAAPSARLGVAFAPGSPAQPVLNQEYAYALDVGNDGDVPLDNLVIIDTVPVEMLITRATTGRYTGLADFAAGEGVRVSYEKNTSLGVFTLWSSSPNTTTDTTLTAPPPGLGAGEYITRVQWEYGRAEPGMEPIAPPVLRGRVTNPDNAGLPVAVGDSIQNCADLTASPGVSRNACQTFQVIAGPAIAIDAPDSRPLGSVVNATATLTGGDPTGLLTFQLFAAGDTGCTDPLFEEQVEVDGVGTYTSPDAMPVAAGAYIWRARYGGDSLHAEADSGCGNAAGAVAVVAPPALSASFGAAEITVGEPTALSFTITNPSANTVPLTAVGLETVLPPGLAVASPNGVSGSCGGGTITATAGSQLVTLAGGTIAVGSSCSFSVHVTAAAPGAVTITTGSVESANGGTGDAATASLTVRARAQTPPATPVAPLPALPPAASTPRTPSELALSCSPARLALLSVTEAGPRVRFRGVAAVEDVGRQVVIRTTARAVAARATVRADGSFEAIGQRPSRRALNKTRYYAELGDRRSPSLKLTRRLRVRLATSGEVVTISGRVAPPLAKPVRPVVIRRLVRCAAGYDVLARVKPGARGRFRVELPRTGGGPALYLAQTRVRTKAGGAIPTFSLVLGEA
jgi:uncharacterized repeat protein (TIGR01451 family)